jgi:hypothetical protein
VALTTRAARVRKVLLVFLIIVIGLSAAGALYQAISVRRESTRYRPSGRLVDVGGRRLHLVCIGQGEPTVVFEPSGFGGAGSGSLARAEIARSMRVCSYDRMGMGWSDPGPDFISAGVLSDDLAHLLDRVPPAFHAAAESVRQEWRPLQLALAQRSSRGTWRVGPGSTHLLANTQPHAVASAVFELLSQAGR